MAWYNDVDASKKWRLGTRKFSVDNKEFIYLKGVASLVAEDLVVYDDAYTAVRSVDGGDKQGGCAVAMAAVDAATELESDHARPAAFKRIICPKIQSALYQRP